MSLTGCFSTQDSPAPKPTVSEVVPTETSSPDAVQQVIIPENIVGMKGDDAWMTLYDLGLEVEWSEDVWIESNWTVETSYPKPGEYAAVGSTVLLKVYKVEDIISDSGGEPPAGEETTTGGLEAFWGWDACERYGENQYRYGFTLHYILGVIAERYEAAEDEWFLKASATITNEYGADFSATVECSVTGSNDSPIVNEFLVY